MSNESSPNPSADGDLRGFFESILNDLTAWSAGVGEFFAASPEPPRAKELDAVVQPLALDFIDGSELPLVGVGFVADHDVLADSPWHMAWWQGSTHERLLLLTMESAGETYVRREWFTIPMETGHGHITGPYVDFLCTDEYTVTLTVPVEARGRRVGVAGADILVESLEGLLFDRLRASGPDASLVNRNGRVVLSVDPQLAAGLLLAPGWQDADADGQLAVPGVGDRVQNLHVTRCGDLPLAVINRR